jgi:ABC-type nitrate/sulfonate/bicarbonate transport system substrate-binding protein
MTKLLNVLIVVLAAALVFVILYPQIQQNRPIDVKFACDSSVASLPLLIGIEESLFVKNRIRPELVFYSDPDKALDDLFAGKVDVGVFPYTTILKRIVTKGETLKVFIGEEYRQSLPVDAIVATAASTIRTINDLKGKRLAYPPQLRDCIPVLLTNIGLRPEDLTLSEVSLSALLGQLTAGAVDAAWIIEPALCPLDTTQFRIVQIGALPRYVSAPFPGAAVGFSSRFVKTYRQGPKRLKISTDAAIAMAEAKADKAKLTLAKYFPYSASGAANCRLPEMQRNVEINRPAVSALANRLKLAGVLSQDVDAKGMWADPLVFTR